MKEKRFLLFPNHLRSSYPILKSFALPLAFHVARHSFAVAALERKITLHMISRLMAHSSITTTEKVYAEFLQSTINDEVINRLSFDFLPTDR